MTQTIVVFGATGYTGRLVVSALRDLGVSGVVAAGRSEKRLAELAERERIPFQVADAGDAKSLRRLLEGSRIVIDTAGPFIELGEPVVRAALEAGAHFMDTTGEQAYMKRILERYHGPARQKQLCVINGQAFEFALGYCAAALLAERHPALHTIDVFNRVAHAGASRGTQMSALAAFSEDALERKGGRLVRRGSNPLPTWVTIPGIARREPAVPFPGGEALHLANQHPHVLNVRTHLVLPTAAAAAAMTAWGARPILAPLARRGALAPLRRRIQTGPEGPTPGARESQSFHVFARGRGPDLAASLLVTGRDAYGITARIAALGAKWLLEARPLTTGVVSTDQVFGARAFLEALTPYGVHVSEHAA